MTPGGVAAVLTITALLITTLISVWQWRHALTKEKTNRLIMLERWADDVGRYHRGIREYLLELGKAGIIDMNRVDLSRFPPPPMPTINGNGK